MKHPILSGSGYKLYTLVWLVVIAAHGSVLYFYYDFSLAIAVADSLVFNLIFGVIVPGLWFIVTFGSLNKDELSLIGTHVGAAFLTILVWLSLSSYFLRAIFFSESEYIAFLANAKVWRVIVGILFYSISVLIFYLIKYYQDMQKRLNRELELQNLLKDSELRMLKSQINPHFIFNSLNSVSALTVSEPEGAREMVIKLSDFLRHSLGKDNTELNTLEQEINNAMLYLEIEKVRFGDKLLFEKNISKKCSQVKVPNLILQPLFENAIKYGVYDSVEPVTIKMKCGTAGEMLELQIINNFDSDSVAVRGEGIGLENVKKRLSLVYGRNDLLAIKRSKNEFAVTIKIPITDQ
ncbi:sensor histidine kinase [Ekhidna sp. To15]|uniref:sensor histidine kinase n=1 Tax=Ekhidna sp. To15 TaxID=3395267 RepID=UPI003F524C59